MSIIEKAVDKLVKESGTEQKPPVRDPLNSGITPSTAGDPKAEDLGSAGTSSPEMSHEPDIETRESTATSSGLPLSERAKSPDQDLGEAAIRLVDTEIEGVLSHSGERSRLAEEYRMIKRPLLVRAFSGDQSAKNVPNLIMVTSALSGEGKTFTSLNLAISIAMEMDRTVLLVDSDLAKPNLSRMLQISERPGFTECLMDPNLEMGDCLLRTDVPKLTVLPAGQRVNRATELLASNTMEARLLEMSSRYADRIVLFDSPPLLATSEASVLARHVGQVAVVIEYGSTPQFLVKEALGLLESSESVSLILNKTRDDFLSRHVGGYGYGYGKGYGYGTYGDR